MQRGSGARRGAGLLLLEQIADLHQDLLLGRELRLVFGRAEARPSGGTLLEVVHRIDEHEVDNDRDGEEADDCADQVAERERDGLAVDAVDRRTELAHRISLKEQRDDRIDDARHDRVDDRGEGTSDVDPDGDDDDPPPEPEPEPESDFVAEPDELDDPESDFAEEPDASDDPEDLPAAAFASPDRESVR